MSPVGWKPEKLAVLEEGLDALRDYGYKLPHQSAQNDLGDIVVYLTPPGVLGFIEFQRVSTPGVDVKIAIYHGDELVSRTRRGITTRQEFLNAFRSVLPVPNF